MVSRIRSMTGAAALSLAAILAIAAAPAAMAQA